MARVPLSVSMLLSALALGACVSSPSVSSGPGVLIGPAPAAALEPPAVDAPFSGVVAVVLPEAVPQKQRKGDGWNRRELQLSLRCDRDGTWAVSGEAAIPYFTHREDNPVTVSLLEDKGDQVSLQIDVEIDKDRRGRTATVSYACTITVADGAVSGTFSGAATYREKGGDVLFDISGRLTGRVDPDPTAPPPDRVRLDGPLVRLVSAGAPLAGAGPDERIQDPTTITAELTIGPDAPADLHVGAWIAWQDGRWFQTTPQGPIGPGRQRLTFSLNDQAGLTGAGPGEVAGSFHRGRAWRAGISLASAGNSRAIIGIDSLSVATEDAHTPVPKLVDLRWDDQATTGQRWTMDFRVEPTPKFPYGSDDFRADLVVLRPDGQEERLPCFFDEPMTLIDRGDREVAVPAGPPRFSARWRPRIPGSHAMRLEWRFADGDSQQLPLTELTVSGEPWDDYARVDPEDSRFFVIGDEPWWPIGLNLHSIFDVRAVERIGTAPTAQRGFHAYDERLTRAAAAGIDCVEIWMSSWNLALEWREDWPGYHGLEGYHAANAARIDRILDRCLELGIRVILVQRNHMQGKKGRNFHLNPWNKLRGGPLDNPSDLFTSDLAREGDHRRRRYVIGRWAEHPAVFSWKLWSEMNLTSAKRDQRAAWHAAEAPFWQAEDPYDHPVTTHWSGRYSTVESAIAEIPAIDMVVFNNYKESKTSLVDQLWSSTTHPSKGLFRFGKPALTTEYGGSWRAGSPRDLLRDLRIGAWVALVAGHAGAPQLWWNELVDQEDLWGPYRSIAAFTAGEELRGSAARPVRLTNNVDALWSGAWLRPGRLLGYVVDRAWQKDGSRQARHDTTRITIGDAVKAGQMTVEWWHADGGYRISTQRIEHPGGPLHIDSPGFDAHLAFKLYRGSPETDVPPYEDRTAAQDVKEKLP